ncbi:MAG: tRNA (adenosine(37)-N6)-threonylcarbamoyltransferase complex ATPase subunit type 1 TsaE [Chloroflexi bacterium]|nr:tRNA (adenosine(37)-N6)-threonylcarbamoyltransferase complex ATPase subunit type 1 TsaE [Chloroflexota bacterium]
MSLLRLDLISASPEQTQAWGAVLGELAQPGDVYALVGDLGSGKTCLVQGIGRGLGVLEAIHSPTFVLANEHKSGRLPLYHVDVYRVTSAAEAVGFGLEDYVNGEGVCVIEWAEKIREALPPERLKIVLRHLGESTRGLRFEGQGERYEVLLIEFERRIRLGDATRN